MLVELLGSYLITPHWEAAVKVPPAASPEQGEHQQLSSCLSNDNRPYVMDGCDEAAATYCSWRHGYRYTTSTATIGSSTDSPARELETKGGSSHNSRMPSIGGKCGSWSGVAVNLLDCCITYPQFIEVLLCVMAARATSLLEPDVKQLKSLTLDEEMQVLSDS